MKKVFIICGIMVSMMAGTASADGEKFLGFLAYITDMSAAKFRSVCKKAGGTIEVHEAPSANQNTMLACSGTPMAKYLYNPRTGKGAALALSGSEATSFELWVRENLGMPDRVTHVGNIWYFGDYMLRIRSGSTHTLFILTDRS